MSSTAFIGLAQEQKEKSAYLPVHKQLAWTIGYKLASYYALFSEKVEEQQSRTIIFTHEEFSQETGLARRQFYSIGKELEKLRLLDMISRRGAKNQFFVPLVRLWLNTSDRILIESHNACRHNRDYLVVEPVVPYAEWRVKNLEYWVFSADEDF